MRVLHITPAYYPAGYWGGPIYSVYSLCNALVTHPDVTLRVLTTDAAGPRRSSAVDVTGFPMHYPGGYEVFFCRRRWAASVSPRMLLLLWPMIQWADVVHLTAVYSSPTIPTLLICRLLGKPVVWSPRGALQRWEGTTRPWLKRVWDLFCRSLVHQRRSVLHVTSSEERQASALRIPGVVSIVIPNGVDLPELDSKRLWKPEGKLRLFYLGRLHPIKGLENLFQALTQLQESASLVICGEGDSTYSTSLRRLARELELDGCVTFRGHIEVEERISAFMGADVCVVPSFSENFGMVVAESLAHGVPVVVSRGAPWRRVESERCGLWVDNSPEGLANAIRNIGSMPLEEMGRAGRKWMEREYGWRGISVRMAGLYRDLCQKSS